MYQDQAANNNKRNINSNYEKNKWYFGEHLVMSATFTLFECSQPHNYYNFQFIS